MKKSFIILFFFSFLSYASDIPLYFVTGANSEYFDRLMNLIGSIHRVNFDTLGHIAVYNLGLSDKEITQLNNIQKLTVYEIEPSKQNLLQIYVLPKVVPGNHMRILGWYAWKPVAIKQALEHFPYVLWIDAGSTILRPVDILFKYLVQFGYFLGTIGYGSYNGKFNYPVSWGTTQFVKNAFKLNTPTYQWILSQECVMGNINGTTREHADKFIVPLYELTNDLRYYQDDGTTPDGYGTARHDQTLLSIIAYQKGLTIHKQDHTQQKPMLLLVDGKEEPFYITWRGEYVCEKTHIYSSRRDISNKNYYTSFIRYKK